MAKAIGVIDKLPEGIQAGTIEWTIEQLAKNHITEFCAEDLAITLSRIRSHLAALAEQGCIEKKPLYDRKQVYTVAPNQKFNRPKARLR